MSTNVVVISGRLGKDPEVKQTNGGKSVCSFSIAVDSGFGDKKKSMWVNVEAWDKTAEAIGRLVTSGKRVAVTGQLAQDEWTDAQTGQKKSRFKIRANQVDVIDFAEKTQADGHGEVSDDDIPF